MNNSTSFSIKILIFSFILSFVLLPVSALAAFSKTNFISDSVMTNKATMTAAEINNLLKENGSFFADYTIPETVSVPYPTADELKYASARQFNDLTNTPLYNKTVAQLIYDEAQEHNVNPRVILATMEKESTAISMSKDQFAGKPNRIAWPLFYMYDETMGECLNSGTNCNHESDFQNIAKNYGGVGQQIAYATAYLGKKMTEYKGSGRCLKHTGETSCYGYEQWNSPISIDGSTFSVGSIASRILYLYTPHVAGAQSFFDLYAKWWGEPNTDSPTPPPSNANNNTAPAPGNDISQYFLKTYNSKVTIQAGKEVAVKTFLGDKLLEDGKSDSWKYDFEPSFGTNDYLIEYKNASGVVAGQKKIQIIRQKLGDINGDGRVDLLDLSVLAGNWGKSNPDETLANLNPEADTDVNILDLSILASNWSG